MIQNMVSVYLIFFKKKKILIISQLNTKSDAYFRVRLVLENIPQGLLIKCVTDELLFIMTIYITLGHAYVYPIKSMTF